MGKRITGIAIAATAISLSAISLLSQGCPRKQEDRRANLFSQYMQAESISKGDSAAMRSLERTSAIPYMVKLLRERGIPVRALGEGGDVFQALINLGTEGADTAASRGILELVNPAKIASAELLIVGPVVFSFGEYRTKIKTLKLDLITPAGERISFTGPSAQFTE